MKEENIEMLKSFLHQQCKKSLEYAKPYNRIGKSFLLFDIDDIERLVDLIKYIAEDEKINNTRRAIKQ